MRIGIALRELNLSIQLEHSAIHIMDGNWGVFYQSFTNHMHSYYELHYVTGGHGMLITSAGKSPLKRGCLYLLPPRSDHEQLTDSQNHLEEYHLAFEVAAGSPEDVIWKQLLSNGYFGTGWEGIEACFDAIAQESALLKYGYQEMIRQNILSIFILVMRAMEDGTSHLKPVTKSGDQRVMLADEAFLFDYRTLTLAALSQKLQLSQRQTQRFIRERYGISFSMLKTRSRLSHAAMLLSTTKLSLEEISFQIGYKEYAHFCKSFKAFYGKTPSLYRASQQVKNAEDHGINGMK